MNVLKHILVVLVFAGFTTMWLPHDVFLNVHQHEHTNHDPNEQGFQFDNQHHHCFQVQISPLKEILPGFILGIIFLRIDEIKNSLFYYGDFIRLIEKNIVRGPPASAQF